MQKPRSSIILLIVIVTTLLAIATSLALFALQARPDSPEDVAEVPAGEEAAQTETQLVTVEGVEVRVLRSIDNQLFMQPVVPQIEVVVPTQPVQEAPQTQEQPTQVPEQTQEQPAQQTDQTQQVIQATAVPVGTANQGVDPIIYQSYTVQNNDTLYNITRQLNTSVTLMAVKGIDQDDLVVGTAIQVPVGNPAYCPGMRPYAIGEGDTIFSIATRRNTTVETLRSINNLDANYTIYSGTIMCVP